MEKGKKKVTKNVNSNWKIGSIGTEICTCGRSFDLSQNRTSNGRRRKIGWQTFT